LPPSIAALYCRPHRRPPPSPSTAALVLATGDVAFIAADRAASTSQVGAYGADVYEWEGDLFFTDPSALTDDMPGASVPECWNPELQALSTRPNVIITPHMAFLTAEVRAPRAATPRAAPATALPSLAATAFLLPLTAPPAPFTAGSGPHCGRHPFTAAGSVQALVNIANSVTLSIGEFMLEGKDGKLTNKVPPPAAASAAPAKTAISKVVEVAARTSQGSKKPSAAA